MVSECQRVKQCQSDCVSFVSTIYNFKLGIFGICTSNSKNWCRLECVFYLAAWEKIHISHLSILVQRMNYTIMFKKIVFLEFYILIDSSYHFSQKVSFCLLCTFVHIICSSYNSTNATFIFTTDRSLCKRVEIFTHDVNKKKLIFKYLFEFQVKVYNISVKVK